MKKIAKKALIASTMAAFIFTSCKSTNAENVEAVSNALVEPPVPQEISQEENTENSIDVPQDSDAESELSLPPFIPEPEKIESSELEDDLSLLTEKIKDDEITFPTEDFSEPQTTLITENIVQEPQSKETKSEEIIIQPEKENIISDKKIIAGTKSSNNKVQREQNPQNESKEQNDSLLQDSLLTLQEEAAKASAEINESNQVTSKITPSRTVDIKNNQFLDINYPGTGWVYLGELDRENNLIFYGRKINSDSTTFTLKSQKSGEAILHFYKNDTLSGKYIDDYIKVKIELESATDNTHITSPDYAKIVPPKPQKKTINSEDSQNQVLDFTNNSTQNLEQHSTQNEEKNISSPNFKTNIQNEKNDNNQPDTESTQIKEVEKTQEKVLTNNVLENEEKSQDENISTEQLFEQAKLAYQNGEFEKSLELINSFLEKTSDRFDEGLYLRAQILESNSAVQNIKDAIANYDLVTKNWPQSKLWQNAKQRSIYLKRFYIDIR